MTIKQVMRHERSTKGTHVYTAIAQKDNAVLSLYVQKTAVDGPPPTTILVTIEEYPNANTN